MAEKLEMNNRGTLRGFRAGRSVKMASAGADWRTNPATQIKWGFGYIQQIYGNPCSAWSFEQANGYY
jgi:hypothetical protein